MDLFSYPIARHVRSKLLASKYLTLNDFTGITAINLSSETGLLEAEAEGLLNLLDGPRTDQTTSLTAAELLVRGNTNRPITTSSKALDEMLGGGIPVSRLTEICGIPGSGKTQLCLQLALNAQVSNNLDGSRGEVLYIDTEGSFIPERLADMAEAMVGKSTGSTLDQFINGVHYRRCVDCESFLETVNALHNFISTHAEVRLIVIDNIAYQFRRDFGSNYQLRTRTMHNVAQILAGLAHKYSIAVVLTNQMTTRIDKDGQPMVLPSLGDSWSHACCNRVVLSFNGEARSAALVKSSYRPYSTAFFHIETAGIRDVPAQAEDRHGCIVGSQLGFYEHSIGTSEVETNSDDRADFDATVVLGAIAKRPRLDLAGTSRE